MNKIISFGIYANQTDKRWNTFIEEMRSQCSKHLILEWDKQGVYFGVDNTFNITWFSSKNLFHEIITLDDYFAEGSVYRVVPDKHNKINNDKINSMEFKGTKDWYLGNDSNVFSREVEERLKNPEYKDLNTNGEIAQCWMDFYDGKIISEEECQANAKLIASAPKLLEALREIERLCDGLNPTHQDIWETAHEAIKQALG